MVDNVTVEEAVSGSAIAADDIAGVKHQRVKLTLGADGINDGDLSSTNPMPIAGAVTVSGVASAANQATEIASLASIDSKLTSPISVSFSGGGLATATEQTSQTTILSAIQTNTGVTTATAPATTMTGAKGSLIFGAVTTSAPSFTNNTQNSLSLTTGGLLRIDGSGTTIPVSNSSLTTIATNSGTQATASNQTSVIGAKTAGTAASSSMLGGGVYLTTPPTMTNNQQAAVQMNVNGAIKVDASATTGLKTQVVDGAGAVVGTTNSNGIIGHNVALTGTTFIFSTVNSSTVQLAASATFTGAIETAINQQAASINLTSDQPGTLIMHQYIDVVGASELPPIVIPVIAGENTNRAITVNGSYIKFTFQNTGAVATTTFNLSVAYGILPATTELGNGNVAINEIAGVATTPLVKGVQGNGFTVQLLSEGGRNKINFFMAIPVIATSTESLVSLTSYTDLLGAVTATTTPAVINAGKEYRLTSMTISYIGVTAETTGEINLRANTAGVVAITSPVVASWSTGNNARGTAGESFVHSLTLDQEFSAGTGIGISIIGRSATQAAANAGYVKVTLTGYEY
jgi:hypothetical protein